MSAPDSTPKRCDGCRFWQSDDLVFGTCRRRSPVYAPDTGDVERAWPITEGFDWCGAHEAVPVPVAERLPGDPAYDAFDAWVSTPGARMYLRAAFLAGRASVKP